MRRSVVAGARIAAAVAVVAVVVVGAGAAVAPAQPAGRVLPFAPLESAKAGETALYELGILDAASRPVSSSEKRYTVDARESGRVKIGKLDLAETADAPEIFEALRIAPPGTPFDGLKATPEAIEYGRHGKKIETTHVALNTKLKDGVTIVVLDAWFSKDVPVFGLVRARTKILGGGAGESVLELVDFGGKAK